MTDEYIREFDTLPKFLPNLRLRRTRRRDQITANMNVTAENNRAIRSHLLGDRDQWCHLRIVDDDDIGASFGGWLQGSFAGEPVAFCVFEDPVGDLVVVFCAEAFVGLGDALEDVVVCFGDAEDAGAWFGDVPVVVRGDRRIGREGVTYQEISMPRAWDSLTRACLMRATPPP